MLRLMETHPAPAVERAATNTLLERSLSVPRPQARGAGRRRPGPPRHHPPRLRLRRGAPPAARPPPLRPAGPCGLEPGQRCVRGPASRLGTRPAPRRCLTKRRPAAVVVWICAPRPASTSRPHSAIPTWASAGRSKKARPRTDGARGERHTRVRMRNSETTSFVTLTNSFLEAWRSSNFGALAALASYRVGNQQSKSRLAGELREVFDLLPPYRVRGRRTGTSCASHLADPRNRGNER